MGGISGGELVVLLLVGFLVVGPEKLPELSKQFARVVRKVVAVARDTGDKVRAELGDDLEDLKSLDPRQYDPRRIVADAMKDGARPARGTGSAEAARAATGAAVTGVGTGAVRATGAAAGSGPASRGAPVADPAGPGAGPGGGAPSGGDRTADPFDSARPAPFDPDAT